MLVIVLKGIAAYAELAAVLGYRKPEIDVFMFEALASTTKDLPVDGLIALVVKAGHIAFTTRALPDEADTAPPTVTSKSARSTSVSALTFPQSLGRHF